MLVYGYILNLRETKLQEVLKEKGINEIFQKKIIINRKKYFLDLYINGEKIKRYKAVFGRNNGFIKNNQNDFITPHGTYRICSIEKEHNNHIFIKINYPNKEDALEAFKNSIISKSEMKEIIQADTSGNLPAASTKLGSGIGIHGIGYFNSVFKNMPFIFNWTNGSAAIKNEDIDELVSIVEIGDTVIINKN